MDTPQIITVNKLVRDNIPQLIENSGDVCETKFLSEDEYFEALKQKLVEEVQEFIKAMTLEQQEEELGDVYEVFLALLKNTKIDLNRFNQKYIEKALKNGRFDKKIYLKTIIKR